MTTTTLAAGTVVRYHGSIEPGHGVCIVTAVAEDGTLTIHDRDYPDYVLRQVRPASVTPTGEAVDLCACGHEFFWAGFRRPEFDACGAGGCSCLRHVPGAIHAD